MFSETFFATSKIELDSYFNKLCLVYNLLYEFLSDLRLRTLEN